MKTYTEKEVVKLLADFGTHVAEQCTGKKLEIAGELMKWWKLNIPAVSTSLYGLYSIDNELMFVHKTREGAKKHQYEFEKEHGMGFYVDPVIVLE